MAARKPAKENGPLERAAVAALRETAKTLAAVEKRNAPAVAAAAELILGCFENGGTVFFCGNGGSAADAQHLAAEFSGRYLVDRPGLPAATSSSPIARTRASRSSTTAVRSSDSGSARRPRAASSRSRSTGPDRFTSAFAVPTTTRRRTAC